MNAIPMRERVRPEFPQTVFAYSDLLQVLRTEGPLDAGALAQRTERIVSNVKRDQQKLRDAGVIRFEGDKMVLTEKGERWCAGQDVAVGLAEIPAEGAGGLVMVRHDELRPNPLNPRKAFGAEEIEEMAASILGESAILQPLLVSPPQDGGRLIFAGERRWRGVGLLIARNEWDPGRALPCTVRDLSPAQSRVVGIVENTQRVPLSWIEQARAYADWCEEENISAREAARRAGKNPRPVQEMVKVIREADPADIARHESGDPNMTAEELRYSVREKTPAAEQMAEALRRQFPHFADGEESAEPVAVPMEETHEQRVQRSIETACAKLNDKQLMVLVEIADKCARQPAGEWEGRELVGHTPCGEHHPDPMHASQHLVENVGLGFLHHRGRSWAHVHQAAIEWLRRNGLYRPESGPDRQQMLHMVRARAATSARAARALQTGEYLTPWLNPPFAGMEGGGVTATDPAQTDIEDFAPRPEKSVVLTVHEQLALVELQHKACEVGEAIDDTNQLAVRIWRAWESGYASDLVSKQLAKWTIRTDGWWGYLTPKGEQWLLEHDLAEPGGSDNAFVSAEHLETARIAADRTAEAGYVTEWLNVESRPSDLATVQPLPAATQAILAEDEEESDDRDADLLAEVATFKSDCKIRASVRAERFYTLARMCGLRLPMEIAEADPDDGVTVVDSAENPLAEIVDDYGQRSRNRQLALAELVALALNFAAGEFEQRAMPVPLRKSITPDYIVCLEDGRRVKSLVRHIRARFDMSPADYIARWRLPADYPMLAPMYARDRDQLARNAEGFVDIWRSLDCGGDEPHCSNCSDASKPDQLVDGLCAICGEAPPEDLALSEAEA